MTDLITTRCLLRAKQSLICTITALQQMRPVTQYNRILMTLSWGSHLSTENTKETMTYYYNNNCLHFILTCTNWANWCTTGISLQYINSLSVLLRIIWIVLYQFCDFIIMWARSVMLHFCKCCCWQCIMSYPRQLHRLLSEFVVHRKDPVLDPLHGPWRCIVTGTERSHWNYLIDHTAPRGHTRNWRTRLKTED